MICQSKRKGRLQKDKPKDVIEKLQARKKKIPSPKVVEHLVVNITTESDDWAKEFMDAGGIRLICEMLSATNSKQVYV